MPVSKIFIVYLSLSSKTVYGYTKFCSTFSLQVLALMTTLLHLILASSEYGADIRPFVQQSNHSEAQIREVLVDMSSEGNIYSSVDDNHYNVV